MNFFKSVFSDDPDPPNEDDRSDPDPEPDSTPAWSFGGLIKTLATKSESVIETYRRDLNEFGSGLKKEIEVAHGSLGTVGTAIDELGSSVLKGTAQIISQGKDAILAEDHESDSSDTNQSSSSKPFSRFEAQVRSVQGDPLTYCAEPEDLDDFLKWKSGFVLEEKKQEIEVLAEENDSIEILYQRVVPESVDHDTFWCRYFYKLHKLKQAEDLRARVVKRAISREEDEDLTWDVDDEEDDNGDSETKNVDEECGKDVHLEKNLELKHDDGELGELSKDGVEAKVVKSNASGADEEDLGWDEIEDLSCIDDKIESRGRPERTEQRKPLSVAADEDEDLSWNIEEDDDDDDQPKKALSS